MSSIINSNYILDRVVVVGAGLLGSSISLALKERNRARQVVAVVKHAAGASRVAATPCFDEVTDDLDAAVQEAALAVICTPVATIPEIARRIAAATSDSTLLTDVGSTKARIVETLDRTIPGRFVGSHPLAGSHLRGAENGRADLFVDRLVVITPTDISDRSAVDSVSAFWQGIGARVQFLAPEAHDTILATTSHVPRLLAAAMAGVTSDECLPYVATGWKDTTRVAAAQIEMWQQIYGQNREAVLAALDAVRQQLDQFRQALVDHDQETLTRLLKAGKKQRDAVGS